MATVKRGVVERRIWWKGIDTIDLSHINIDIKRKRNKIKRPKD